MIDRSTLMSHNMMFKVFLLTLKYMPMLVALCYMVNSLTLCVGIDTSILGRMAGMSPLACLFTYTASLAFDFCLYHRMFLWYILVNEGFYIADCCSGAPISKGNTLNICDIMLGSLMFVILYFHVKRNKGIAG